MLATPTSKTTTVSPFRRWARGGMALMGLVACVGLARAGSVVVAVIGDFGGAATGAASASNELAVASLVKRWKPDLIVTTGDNNYPSGAASTIDQNIGQFYREFIHPYTGTYGSGASSNRFFPCLGNHDWDGTGGQPYFDYFALPGNERYYRYRSGSVEFFALNSNADPDGTSTNSVQGRWLQAQLAASTARWKLVVLHHPPYSADAGGAGTAAFRWPYAAWGAAAVLAGHDHIYARIHTNNAVYFINGLGGEEISSLGSVSAAQIRYNADFGAMRLEATETNLVFHFINRRDVVIDTHVLGEPVWTPFILAPPQDQISTLGKTVRFTVQAAGPNPLRYQWQFNSVILPGATNSTLTITNAQWSDEGDYTVAVSNTSGAVRAATARLTVLRHPLITQQPQSQSIIGGAMVTFAVVAEGAGLLRHQWRFNGAPLVGATNSSLVLSNVQLHHAGDYTVRITDEVGAVLSESANLQVRMRPVVTLQPVSQSVGVGGTVVFSVAAIGTLPMGYSWRWNGRVMTNIVLNQSTCFWAVANVQLTNAGSYRVGVTNIVGPASGLTSNAVLTVLADTDGDGIPDDWETANGFAIGDPGDAGNDPDQDGLTNLQEYLSGTDPASETNYLRIQKFFVEPSGVMRLQFDAVSNRTYAVEFLDEAELDRWQVLSEIVALSTNHSVEVLDLPPLDPARKRFYRVVTPRVP
jgi:tartrate-resistant acid phosphatase type 5